MHPFPAWLDALCSGALLLGLVCSIVILVDVVRRPQRMVVMNIVWPVCALFGALLVVWLYFRYGRAETERAGQVPVSPPFAIRVATGTLHCGTGCALGDVAAEWLAFFVPGIAVIFWLALAIFRKNLCDLGAGLRCGIRSWDSLSVFHHSAYEPLAQESGHRCGA